MATPRVCSFRGCERTMVARGLCKTHWDQQARGSALSPIGSSRAPRQLIDHPTDPSSLLVPLTRGMFAIIDRNDGDIVGARPWCAFRAPRSKTFYAQAFDRYEDGKPRTVTLHLFLWRTWGMPPTPEVDHANTNGLDCRRENLRAATRGQNAHNVGVRADSKTGLKGVTWYQRYRKWVARIAVDGRQKCLGYFDSPDAASAAYANAAIELHGNYANLGRP
jgi:hypothetical protein